MLSDYSYLVMKNVVFIVSHLHSGSNLLIQTLNKNPRVHVQDTKLSYNHPDVLKNLFSLGHKLDNSSAVFGDHILFNADFSSSSFYDYAKFIYVIRDGRSTLEEILSDKSLNYDLKSAELYYSYRLRRIYEMATKTPEAIFLNYKQMYNNNNLKLVEDYLNLKDTLEKTELDDPVFNLPSSQTEKCQETFERYFYKFKKIGLRGYN